MFAFEKLGSQHLVKHHRSKNRRTHGCITVLIRISRGNLDSTVYKGNHYINIVLVNDSPEVFDDIRVAPSFTNDDCSRRGDGDGGVKFVAVQSGIKSHATGRFNKMMAHGDALGTPQEQYPYGTFFFSHIHDSCQRL